MQGLMDAVTQILLCSLCRMTGFHSGQICWLSPKLSWGWELKSHWKCLQNPNRPSLLPTNKNILGVWKTQLHPRPVKEGRGHCHKPAPCLAVDHPALHALPELCMIWVAPVRRSAAAAAAADLVCSWGDLEQGHASPHQAAGCWDQHTETRGLPARSHGSSAPAPHQAGARALVSPMCYGHVSLSFLYVKCHFKPLVPKVLQWAVLAPTALQQRQGTQGMTGEISGNIYG